MPEIFTQVLELLERGTLPVMLPLVFACLGIGFLTIDRVLYLYDPRTFFAIIPGMTRSLNRDKQKVVMAQLATLRPSNSRVSCSRTQTFAVACAVTGATCSWSFAGMNSNCQTT